MRTNSQLWDALCVHLDSSEASRIIGVLAEKSIKQCLFTWIVEMQTVH